MYVELPLNEVVRSLAEDETAMRILIAAVQQRATGCPPDEALQTALQHAEDLRNANDSLEAELYVLRKKHDALAAELERWNRADAVLREHGVLVYEDSERQPNGIAIVFEQQARLKHELRQASDYIASIKSLALRAFDYTTAYGLNHELGSAGAIEAVIDDALRLRATKGTDGK